MIEEKTVFILGAGSAVPYNFPTGDELKENICQNFLKDYLELPILGERHPDIIKDIRQLRAEAAKKFTTALIRATGLSIDQFLQINESHLMEGKIAILLYIMRAERDSIFRKGKEDWYSYLFKKMMTKCVEESNPEYFYKNEVSFITFNYDRSLEYFLADSFVNNFSDLRKEVKLLDFVDRIPIHHVYGSLGKLPWQNNPLKEDVLDFGASDNRYLIKKSTQNCIKLIDERDETDKKIIQETISNAKRIFFLGFDYLKENLEALELPNSLSPHHKTHIFGTALGVQPQRKNEVINFLTSAINPSPKLKPVNSYDLLYEFFYK